ncbi:RAD55 family ATPase [Aquibacillus sediminis]|uniref:RAD55 family ATPase n=1 Tax=Aquibacillus sediminis TaxID=2574734 RepID=UPI001FE99A8F|nr:ATPase domain-containing protein [Aquibacillus sediminis]
MTTGIEGLDQVVGKGLPEGSVTIIEGAPGTGKTNLSLQFLLGGIEQADKQPGAYITFEELPEQLYEETKSFGWDLRAYEKQNLLRVICLSPDIFLEELLKTNGFVTQLLDEIGCKRLVIDSISLFRYLSDNEHDYRKTFYSLRNSLRRKKITSLFIKEADAHSDQNATFEQFVVDGVISLKLDPLQQIYRKRTLEVKKMRGCAIEEGEHIFNFNDKGVKVVPALSMIEDKTTLNASDRFLPTGITGLDRILHGGIPEGSMYMIDTNSKANYRYLLASIVAEQLKKGKKALVLLTHALSTMDFEALLGLFGLSLHDLIKNDQILFLDFYDRIVPKEYENAVINLFDQTGEEFNSVMHSNFISLLKSGQYVGDDYLVTIDSHTLISSFGEDFVIDYLAKIVPTLKGFNVSSIMLNNYRQISERNASYFERISDGIIKTWVDGRYQFVQVNKSAQGVISKPLIVENSQQAPFIELV